MECGSLVSRQAAGWPHFINAQCLTQLVGVTPAVRRRWKSISSHAAPYNLCDSMCAADLLERPSCSARVSLGQGSTDHLPPLFSGAGYQHGLVVSGHFGGAFTIV